MDFGHWLSGAAGRHPDRVAVEAPDESVSYRELLLRAVRAAGALHVRGVKRGQPVGLALEPGLPFVEALHGCLLLGAPAVPVDPRLAEREREAILRDVEETVSPPAARRSRRLPAARPARADATALIVHTSGTTGRPQPVEITYGNIRANARGLAQAMELGDDERWLCPLPLSHVGGLMVVLRSTLMATTAVLGPVERRVGRRHHDSRRSSRPSCSACWTRARRPARTLRRILLGGGPMPRALLVRARAAGFPVCPSYGLTQACSTVTVGEPGDVETAGPRAARRRRGDHRRRRDHRLRRRPSTRSAACAPATSGGSTSTAG